jgi:hypothetical protein
MCRIRMAVVVLSAVVMGTAGIARALAREGRLVSLGARPWDVQAICGDPTQASDTVDILLKEEVTRACAIWASCGVRMAPTR